MNRPSTSWHCYIGGYRKGPSHGITCATLSASGGIQTVDELGGIPNPSFLIANAAGDRLYAVNEVDRIDGEASGAISALKRDPNSGALTPLGRTVTAGKKPCHLALSHDGRHCYTASYESGVIGVHAIADTGIVEPLLQSCEHSGSGPHPRQSEPHPHGLWVSPCDRFVLACDLGTDHIEIYQRNANSGHLEPHGRCKLAAGSGPRHLASSPDGAHCYIVNELDNSVTAATWDAQRGVLAPFGAYQTLPADFTGTNTTAEILIPPSGRFAYVTNRGHDSLAVFRRDLNDGSLSLLGHISSGGKHPRHAWLIPNSDLLAIANQHSDAVAMFRIDDLGRPPALNPGIQTPQPSCVMTLPVSQPQN